MTLELHRESPGRPQPNIQAFRQALSSVTMPGHAVQPRGWRQPPIDPQYEEWKRVESNMKRLRLGHIGEPNSIVPSTFEQYLEHKSAFEEMMATENEVRLQQLVEEERINKLLGHIVFDIEEMPADNDGLSTVLGEPTIWTPVHRKLNPFRELAPWPAAEEFREEGDERHTSQFGRFMPCPRMPGNPTVNWKQKPFMIQEKLDRVFPIPLGRRCHPGLYHDAHGMPYDDDRQIGRTAYVEKNPFAKDWAMEREATYRQVVSRREELMRGFQQGIAGHGMSSGVHPLAMPVIHETFSSRNPNETRMRGATLSTDLPGAGRMALTSFPMLGPQGQRFSYRPDVREFVPFSPIELNNPGRDFFDMTIGDQVSAAGKEIKGDHLDNEQEGEDAKVDNEKEHGQKEEEVVKRKRRTRARKLQK